MPTTVLSAREILLAVRLSFLSDAASALVSSLLPSFFLASSSALRRVSIAATRCTSTSSNASAVLASGLVIEFSEGSVDFVGDIDTCSSGRLTKVRFRRTSMFTVFLFADFNVVTVFRRSVIFPGSRARSPCNPLRYASKICFSPSDTSASGFVCARPASVICFSNLSTDAPTVIANSLTVTSAIGNPLSMSALLLFLLLKPGCAGRHYQFGRTLITQIINI